MLSCMQKTVVWMMAAIVAAFTLGSCAPDPIYSYPPEYEKEVRFTLDDPKTIVLTEQDSIDFITSCQRGDSVTALIRVRYTGSLITRADYYWTLKGEDGTTLLEKKIEQIAPQKQSTPPMWTFNAPDSIGRYQVHFRAWYVYSASTEEGLIYGGYPTSSNYTGASTVKSTITVK